MEVRMHRLRLIATMAILAILGQTIWAQSVYEGFNLTFPLYSTGTGLSGSWQPGGFNAFQSGYTAGEQSLAFNGLVTTPGHVSSVAFDGINGAVRNLLQPLGANGTTAYMSVLLRPQGTLNDGIFNGFFGVTLNGSLGEELFVGKPGGGAEEEWVMETRGGSGQVASGVPTVVGQTALLVVKAQFKSGNDTFTLYVNPTPGQPEPSSNLIKTDLDLATVSRIGIYSTGAFDVDEIRIGSSFESVTPRVPFAGTPGAPNCSGKTVSALTQDHGGLSAAASDLGFASVAALQGVIAAYCSN
jgi:hypothetical protein